MCNIFFIASLDFVVAWQAQGADDEDNYEEDGSWINWVARYNRIIVDCSSVIQTKSAMKFSWGATANGKEC